MKRISWLKNPIRQVLTLLIAVIFVVAPALSHAQSVQAQAETLVAAKGELTDRDTAERVSQQAEDRLGDRDIGDTGLKNINRLGENIPETADLARRQTTSDNLKGQEKAGEGIQDQLKGAVKGAKRAVKDATS